MSNNWSQSYRGDFNYGPSELEQLGRLAALGFREVQDLRAWQTGRSAEPTGRGSKRIDQLWISPELQQAYVDAEVAWDHWADHAALSATFSNAGLSCTITSWPCPQPFPWPQDWSCAVDVDFHGDLTVEYARFWHQVETHGRCWVQHQGVPVSKRQCGRAGRLEPKPYKQFCSPVK